MQRNTIKAIHDDDLEDLLKELNVYDDFISQKLKCIFCDTVVTSDNLHSLFPEYNYIRFCCDKPECIKKLTIMLEKK